MQQSSFYKYSTWILLLLNIGLVFFVFLRPPHPGAGPFNGSTVKKLTLDESQDKAFVKSADHHKAIVKSVNQEQNELLRKYFSTLTKKSSPENVDALLEKIEGLENQKIVSTYNHLNEVKMLLREEQLADFDGFVEHIIRVITNEAPPPPPE